jgi:hypothetical protein
VSLEAERARRTLDLAPLLGRRFGREPAQCLGDEPLALGLGQAAQQALQARQRLLDEGRSIIDRTRTATEQHAAEIAKLNELLQAGTIDQAN